MQFAEQAKLPPGAPSGEIHDLVERGQALKKASDLLGKFKHEMMAKHNLPTMAADVVISA